MNFNELTPEEQRRLIQDYPAPSRMNYDPTGVTQTKGYQNRADSLYYSDTGKTFKGGNNVPVFSANDMRRNPQRYWGRPGQIVHPYMVDLSDAGQPGNMLYNEYGKTYRLTNRIQPPPEEDDEDNPKTLRKMSAKAKER
jgi:hypothetical protein